MEALPTPSDHVPVLMKRVKPQYLSRTYDIPLPVSDGPSVAWDSEVFLDKLARMKGRLLKGGEPDIEGVAKIVLSDWVRGRIPFFVPPPERPEALNEAEERARKKAKGKAKEKEFVPSVTQKLGGIIQKNTYIGEDVKPLDEEFAGDRPGDGDEWTGFDEDKEDDESEPVDESSKKDIAADSDEEEEVAWNDVFADDRPDKATEAVQPTISLSGDDSETPTDSDEKSVEDGVDEEVSSQASDEEAGGRRKRKSKEPRMKTNKVCC